MQKPTSRLIELFDYFECSEYIFKKYKISDELKQRFWQERLAPYIKNDVIYCMCKSIYGYDSLEEYFAENSDEDIELIKIELLFFTEFCLDSDSIYLKICW